MVLLGISITILVW